MSRERIAALQSRMRETQIDLAVIGSTTNTRYLLGFAPHADERLSLLLVQPNAICMVVPKLNAEEVAAHTDIELVRWADETGPQEALRQALARLGTAQSVAVDGAMRADALLELQSLIHPTSTHTSDVLLAPLRERKSSGEIEALQRAAAQADRAMQAGINACKPGTTEAEVAWAVEAAFRQDGDEQVDFTLIAAGPNGAYPHHHSGAQKMQVGHAIILDIGATLNGYKSDITRMVYLGKPTEEFRRAYDAVYDANQRALEAVRPGVTAGEVDRVARKTLENAGLGEYFTHRTGHGLGLDGHELPWIMSGATAVLQEGMVFSIEPGVYRPGQFGVRVEDIVAVTESGGRNLTGSDHALVIKG
jgi:Xaa-Pro aminopeptidase